MLKVWFDEACEDYVSWQTENKKTLKRINTLLKDIERSNFYGIGKPEPLSEYSAPNRPAKRRK